MLMNLDSLYSFFIMINLVCFLKRRSASLLLWVDLSPFFFSLLVGESIRFYKVKDLYMHPFLSKSWLTWLASNIYLKYRPWLSFASVLSSCICSTLKMESIPSPLQRYYALSYVIRCH